MKRRNFVRALVAAPVAPSLVAQQTPGPAAPAAARPVEESPKLEVATPDETSDPLPRFFTEAQMSTLRRLCDLLTPGALSAGVPEFLDFLVGESAAEKQQLYRTGLDALNAGAKRNYAQAFANLDAAQAGGLLLPLHAVWTYEEPSEPLARFLLAAKIDVRTATMNSKEYSATSSGGGRRGGANGLYWYPLD
jgi:hypothetical protein